MPCRRVTLPPLDGLREVYDVYAAIALHGRHAAALHAATAMLMR